MLGKLIDALFRMADQYLNRITVEQKALGLMYYDVMVIQRFCVRKVKSLILCRKYKFTSHVQNRKIRNALQIYMYTYENK
jgi:hypothetical protein